MHRRSVWCLAGMHARPGDGPPLLNLYATYPLQSQPAIHTPAMPENTLDGGGYLLFIDPYTIIQVVSGELANDSHCTTDTPEKGNQPFQPLQQVMFLSLTGR